KTVKQLKLRVGLIVFQYLRVSFFPDTFIFYKLLYKSCISISSGTNSRYFCNNCLVISGLF
ncbi:hypothetical protein, partial [Lactobacillus gallinarum]|uniref:hypothetical protein n=1 Tax=Lactobacillus gallinarum TaxID=52242 RepID=UPI003D2EB753